MRNLKVMPAEAGLPAVPGIGDEVNHLQVGSGHAVLGSISQRSSGPVKHSTQAQGVVKARRL